jgi:hypothetical protein
MWSVREKIRHEKLISSYSFTCRFASREQIHLVENADINHVFQAHEII